MIDQRVTKRVRAVWLGLALSLVAVLMTVAPVAANHDTYCGHGISGTYVHNGQSWQTHFKYHLSGATLHRVWYYKLVQYAPGQWQWIKQSEATIFCG